MANPFAQVVNSVGSLAAGHIVLASEWNAAVGGLYTYINGTILGGLNKMSAKGDTYIFDGANIQVVPTGGAGNDGKVWIADSGQALGVRYGSIANVSNLTTKGDLLGYDTANNRVPVGADGTFLQADSGQALGVGWTAPPGVPLGGIIIWDTSQRAIPAGYNICDGGTYNGFLTPNMQGLYLVGAGGGVNAPAASGMGNVACGTIAGDTSAGTGLGPTHQHNVAFTVVSIAGPGQNVGVSLAANLSTGSKTVTPRYGALALIMRTS